MINAELIDEGYCSVSKRASLSNWDCMDFSNTFDLAASMDATQDCFNPATLDHMFATVQPMHMQPTHDAYHRPVWKTTSNSTSNTSAGYSLGSSCASLDTVANVCGAGPAAAAGAAAGAGAVSNAAVWYDPNTVNNTMNNLPPLQRSSTAPSPLFTNDFAQPFPWNCNVASSSQTPVQVPVQLGSTPFGTNADETMLRPLVVHSPGSASEAISSPDSAGTHQALSPSDERRLRNNEASRRSRQNQKTKNEELQIKLYQLELENLSLKKNIDEVTKMVKFMKEKLVEYMQSKS